MTVLNINNLQLGEPTLGGHEVYLNACYAPDVDGTFYKNEAKKSRHVIFKKNKYNKKQYSQLEVAFTQLARLFLAKGLTANQMLVVDDQGNVVGLAADHLCYVIGDQEGFKQPFYNITSDGTCRSQKISKAEEIPLYFLNQLPPGFFSQLLNAEQEGILAINYSSLASILTSSYTLEEDDLHKGNFGFYLVEKRGKPEAVFFKIDHDLMFADAIMSFYNIRTQHLFLDEHAFDFTADDLLNFPNLQDSSNAYWPTKKSIIPNPWNPKGYHSDEEVDAFAGLSHVAAFKKAKWLSFYKHILVTTELSELALAECLDKSNANDRAQIALMAQAVSARQARLKSVLFSLPEFRDLVSRLSTTEKSSLMNELLDACPLEHKERIGISLTKALAFYETYCLRAAFEEGDTPLHTAIKLGDFRYEETLSTFGHLVNHKNKAGKTPLDTCLELLSQTSASKDIRRDLRFTMKYLLKAGAHQSDAFKAFNEREQIEGYQFQTLYINKAQQTKTYEDLKELLRDIGEDHSYCLKFKKKMAVECIKQFINHNFDNPQLPHLLTQLKKDISTEAPEVKYIRQLRSRLWIIRQIRGLYGWTSTQGEINVLINQHVGSKKHSSCSFFNPSTKERTSTEPDALIGAPIPPP
jgi:hypothetical protein